MRDFEFQQIVAELFKQLGYGVQEEARIGGVLVDLIIDGHGRRSPVETSAPLARFAMAKLRMDADRLQTLVNLTSEVQRPILVIAAELTPAAKAWSQAQYDLEIWDHAILIEKSKQLPDISARLSHFMPLNTTEEDLGFEKLNANLQGQLNDHFKDKCKMTADEYEILCMRVFNHLFDPHLYGFQRQAKTVDGGNRYDFICRIRSGNLFWDSIRQDFRTKAILFECKNYAEKVGADQVYSTERYLFKGALRTVCFLVSRLGANESAVRAAQGAMRESGKLLLLLSNIDLIEMLKLKTQEGAPESFLDKKIWDFVVSLPR